MRITTKAGIAGVALATAATITFGAQSASGAHEERSSAYGISLGGTPGQPAAAFPEGPRTGGGELPAELEQLAAGGVLVALSWPASPPEAQAGAPGWIVNSTNDAVDANVGDNICQTATPGECTLRAAFQEANAQPGTNNIGFSGI